MMIIMRNSVTDPSQQLYSGHKVRSVISNQVLELSNTKLSTSLRPPPAENDMFNSNLQFHKTLTSFQELNASSLCRISIIQIGFIFLLLRYEMRDRTVFYIYINIFIIIIAYLYITSTKTALQDYSLAVPNQQIFTQELQPKVKF